MKFSNSAEMCMIMNEMNSEEEEKMHDPKKKLHVSKDEVIDVSLNVTWKV